MLVIDHTGQVTSHVNKVANVSDAALFNRLVQATTVPGSGYEKEQHFATATSSSQFDGRYQAQKMATIVSRKSALYEVFVKPLGFRRVAVMLFLVLAEALAEETRRKC